MTNIGHTTRTKTGGLLLTVVAILLALSLSLLAAQRQASASTTFLVNIPGDTKDADTTDNLCDVNPFGPGDQCTLRAAIQQANATPGADVINFGIPDSFGEGVKTIHVGATSPSNGPLPTITDTVTINGYSQKDSSVNTLAKGTNAKLMIQLDGTASTGDSTGLYINAPDVVVRGLVINRFAEGIVVESNAANTRIVGDFIGPSPSGTAAPGNPDNAVSIYDVSGVTNNTVGGSTPAGRNLISGNAGGVIIGSDGNQVSNNLIGVQSDGTSPLGNGFGVLVSGSHNLVGGAPSYANTIAFNHYGGVYIQAGLGGPAHVGNRITSNSIFSNGGLGIDLSNDGVTPNDAGDQDTGVNNLQNKPVLSSAKKGAGKTTIKGKLNSTPGKTFQVQFFSNPKGTSEGKRLLDSKSVTTDGTGNVSFTSATTKKVALGQNITATATNSSTGDTSEFSAPRKVVAS